ncbi:ATP-binding protein [Streptomyces sp. NPDC059070]|uniref:ATP-binding protein n=1 Tax=Streptomyces sp. NPDC059070 TaxID=3346713 RepID=UPI0036785247
MYSTIRPGYRRIVRSSPVHCLPLEPGSAGAARRYVAAFLGGARHGALARGGALEEDTLLVVSELVTNAVRHGAGPIWLCLRHVTQSDGREALHLLVGDHGPGCDLDALPTGPSTDATSGRGLGIVDALASAWGSTRARNHHVMWASLRIVPSASAAPPPPRPAAPARALLATAG